MRLMLFVVFSGLVALVFQTAATAADATGCTAPAWATQPPAGYRIRSCQTHAFDEIELDLTAGRQKASGRSTAVTYELAQGAKDHSAAEVRSFYVDAATKAGAALMSRANDIYGATLMKKSPAGDEWMMYDHGSGNAQSTGSFTLTTLDVIPMPQEVVAQTMTGPLDVASKTCVNPPWLKQQFAYFAVGKCEGKAWDAVDVWLPTGKKRLEGRHLTVTYRLTDPGRAPTAVAVARNYIAALQAIGARQMSKPGDNNNVVFMQQAPQGEIWYIYSHGGGNDKATTGYSLETVVVAPFPQEVVAQAMTAPMSAKAGSCTSPPWLQKQFDYFTLGSCSYRDVDQVTLDLPGGKKTLAGRYMVAVYKLTDPKRDPSALTVQKNYVNALQAIGAQLVSKPDDIYNAVLTQKTPVGDLWYVYKHGGGSQSSTTSYDLVTVEVGGPPPKTCTLEVYGVNFDFNKATLRPDSEPVLQQLLALFSGDASFRAEIGGHTDNIGKADYNLKLSRERADAVKTWLLAHGVDAARITTSGYGDTRPLVPNTSDENRFKNRRVELKRNDCKS